jgi:hypothetical protein
MMFNVMELEVQLQIYFYIDLLPEVASSSIFSQ